MSKINELSKNWGNEIISIVDSLLDKTIDRSKIPKNRYPLPSDEWISFSLDDAYENVLGLYVDALAKNEHTGPILRASGIYSDKLDSGKEQFTSMSIIFTVNQSAVKKLTKKQYKTTLDDLRALLADNQTCLKSLRLSNNSLGKETPERFFDIDDPNQQVIDMAKLVANVNEVLGRLRARANIINY